MATLKQDYASTVIAYANSALQHSITVLNALVLHIFKKISVCLIASKATILTFKNKNALPVKHSVSSALVKNNVPVVKTVIIF